MSATRVTHQALASLASDSVRPGTLEDAIDGVVPAFVVSPSSEAEVLRVIEIAQHEEMTLAVSGSGSAISLGNPPRRCDLRISTLRMNSIVEHSPHDLTVTVQSGVSLLALNAKLALEGQRVPVDLPYGTAATVGGIVSANRTGGFARGFGSPRDLTLGLDAVDGRGRLLRCGGRVVKNVAGYDLTRLFVGSHGTLGVVTQVTLRTVPVPVEARTLALTLRDSAIVERMRTVKEITELPLAALDFEFAQRSWRILARIEGDACEVAYQRARLTDVCEGNLGKTNEEWTSPIHALSHETFVASLGVPPARAVGIAAQLADELSTPDTSLRIAGRLHDGLLRVFGHPSAGADATRLAARLDDAAHRYAARMALERVSPEIKMTFDVWGPSTEAVHLMAGIKRTFDPDSRLAPGRFIGRL